MDVENFKNKCYEAYKLDWMLSHGQTITDMFKVIHNEIKENLMCFPISEPNAENILGLVREAETSFEQDTGFAGGTIYACKDEFLTHEFMDAAYMEHLFRLMGYGAQGGENMEYWRKIVSGEEPAIPIN